MKKRIFSAFLAFLLTSVFVPSASAARFNDVPNDFWASEAITWAAEKGLVSGTSAMTFSPHEEILRGQITTILYHYAGSPPVEQNSVYSDVTSNHYYFNASIWAAQNHIFIESRIASSTLDANVPISRAEFCAMLMLFSIHSGTYVAPLGWNAPFTDIGNLDETMVWAIQWAYHHGIVSGTSTTTFSPNETLTRAAAAVMLHHYENYAKTNSQLLAEERARELVEYYACPYPQMIEDDLVNTYGFSVAIAERAVSASINKDTWKPFAAALTDSFFYSSPEQPTKNDMRNYLTTTLGFDPEVADYAIEEANLPWGLGSSYTTYDWISLTELSNFGFSAKAAWGTIMLRYLTNEEYIFTGLPSQMSIGSIFSLDFNGKIVPCMFYQNEDNFSSPPDSWFFLDKYSLIDVGILTEDGVSDSVRNGVPQKDMLASSDIDVHYPSGESSASSGLPASGGSASITVPSHSETEGTLVWVPTKGGTKYHNRSGCSQMEDPIQVSIETAKAHGYTACGRCY